MYQHMLVPTDGTELSKQAIVQAFDVAKQLGVRVSVLRVSGKPVNLVFMGLDLTALPDDIRARITQEIEAHFSWVKEQAAKAGVDCETVRVESEHPWQGILETAKARGCDVIAMASHGRSGMSAKLIGSETQKVLVHSHVPVLVLR